MRLLLPLLLVGISTPRIASAAPPCDGCLVEGDGSKGLVVVLHGDEGSPLRLARAWKAAAKAHGLVVLAPKCPAKLGCTTGSFWRWGKDPEWLFSLADEVAKEKGIDAKHRYLAGWSGGASYMGMHADRWAPRFAALSFAGGGMLSGSPRCAHPGPTPSAPCAPVHYLAGDRNPLFELQVLTRKHLEGCGHAVTWDLRKGADHEGEWRAYEKAIDGIAAFFERAGGPCALAAPPPPPPPEPEAPAPSASQAPSAAAAAPPPSAPRGGCACEAGRSEGSGALGVLLVALARFARRIA